MVAMSGGVDSSVAAALLKERGWEVIGVSMQLWDHSVEEDAAGAGAGSCCSLDDLYDARRVAHALGIPYYVMNLEREFRSAVVDYFVESYAAGATPNPCIKCNEVMKFRVLLRKARAMGIGLLATGHYARIAPGPRGPRLLRGVDGRKDQSYFLFTMTADELSSVLFPIGGMTKDEVRAEARRLGLGTSEKAESQEICFIPRGGRGDFLAGRIGGGGGEIVDTAGRVLGRHRGLYRYTVGQRRGLDLPDGPYYVVEIDSGADRLVVGRSEELLARGLTAGRVNWINGAAAEGELTAKIRYRHGGVACRVERLGADRVSVDFARPQRAVAPGQAVVFYSGDEVVGGGWIEEALR